jgi:hypothetical protein
MVHRVHTCEINTTRSAWAKDLCRLRHNLPIAFPACLLGSCSSANCVLGPPVTPACLSFPEKPAGQRLGQAGGIAADYAPRDRGKGGKFRLLSLRILARVLIHAF